MTFETMMAAASPGPRRRTSAGASFVAIESLCCVCATMDMALLREDPAGNVETRELDPVRRALFGENHRADVDEVAVLQHVGSALRRIAGGAGRRPDGQHRRAIALGDLDALQEYFVPLLVLVALDLLEQHVEGERADFLRRGLLDPE